MRFDDPTLYGRDDETDEYSDSGAYGESLEEDLEEEEEEEEEPVVVEEDDEIGVPLSGNPRPAPVTPSGGGDRAALRRRRRLRKKPRSGKESACQEKSSQETGKKSRKETCCEKEGGEEKASQESCQEKVCRQKTSPLEVHHGLVKGANGGSPVLALFPIFEPAYLPSGTIASASISSNISGETRAVIAIMVLAGRMSRKNSPCAFPTFSQSAMLVRNTRVRTTSFNEAPARSSARSIFLSV